MKLPWFKFFPGDWLKEPSLTVCSPATRGIWMDLLCVMHESGRLSNLAGTSDQLARLARCSTADIAHALVELQNLGVAEVTSRNNGVTDYVTVTSRRLKREEKAREHTRKRVSEFRRNADVTPEKREGNREKSEVRGQKSEVREERELQDACTARAEPADCSPQFAERPSWAEFWAYCQSQHCGLAAEWYAREKFEAAEADNWRKAPNWQAYARRCKCWWDSDGKPMEQVPWRGRPQKRVPKHEEGF